MLINRYVVYFILAHKMNLKPWEVDKLPRKMVEVFMVMAEKAGDIDGN